MKKCLVLSELFWRKVEKADSCWIWNGSKSDAGYGTLSSGRRGEAKSLLAHRVSWEIHFGPIPEGAWVLHHCDNPPCVRPDHLFLGDCAANVMDKVQKGRQAKGDTSGPILHPECFRRGETTPWHKLTEKQVVESRALYFAGGISRKDLANSLGVSEDTVKSFLYGYTWKHLAPPDRSDPRKWINRNRWA